VITTDTLTSECYYLTKTIESIDYYNSIEIRVNLKNYNMWSNCCGAEPSYISEEMCGECLEHADFDEDEDN